VTGARHGNRFGRGREALECPAGVERPPRVVLPVDEDVVAPPDVHRQPGLGRVQAVVTLDQVVHLVEAPSLDAGPPRALERGAVARVLAGERKRYTRP
jgi:hypothetical protein